MPTDAAGSTRLVAPLVLLGLLLAGCASDPFGSSYGSLAAGDGQGSYRVGRPYEIKGVWYYPKVDYDYDKTGVASWYGGEFVGRLTANGEIFDLNRLTAANTTLPMPSIVEVTNLQNGRSLRLRVNDRGPFVDGRLIDVSRRAAQLLGFEAQGTAPVEVKIVKDASIRVAEEAMRNSGQVLLADAGAAATTAAVGPPPASYPSAAAPVRTATEAASRPRSRAPRPRPTRPAPLPSMAQAAPTAATALAAGTGDAPRRSSGAYAALSRFALIAPAEAAPLPSTARPAPERNTLAGPTRTREMPLSRSRTVADMGGGPPGRLYVQAGAFSLRDNAQRVQTRIAPLGVVRVMSVAVNGVQVYRVRLGPVENVEQADRLLQRVVSSGYPGARIVTD
jgi:rare lipoprotein A